MIAMIQPSQRTDWTTAEVAAAIGRTDGRVRQLCIQHKIGRLISSKLRLLTDDDVAHIRTLIRAEKKSEPSA
jgi:hypothetical protein